MLEAHDGGEQERHGLVNRKKGREAVHLLVLADSVWPFRLGEGWKGGNASAYECGEASNGAKMHCESRV